MLADPGLRVPLSLSLQPVPVMKLVEVIPGLQTSKETLATTLALAEALGKVSQRGDGRTEVLWREEFASPGRC